MVVLRYDWFHTQVHGRGVPPEALQVIVRSCRLRENVDDEVAVIDQNPFGALITLDADRPPAGFFHAFSNLIANCLPLPGIAGRADYKVVGERGDFAEVEDFQIFGFFGLGRPGRNQPIFSFVANIVEGSGWDGGYVCQTRWAYLLRLAYYTKGVCVNVQIGL